MKLQGARWCCLAVMALCSSSPGFCLPVDTTTLVSQGSAGEIGNAASTFPFVSANGRYAVFYSSATNLVANDLNGMTDVFRRDLKTGVTKRLSVSSAGGEANSHSYVADISANGRYVLFSSDATNLVDNDTNGVVDAFLADAKLGTVERISTTSEGAQANGVSYPSAISRNGRYVLLSSYATNLISGETDAREDVFLKDRRTGAVTRISGSRPGTATGDCYGNDLSFSTDRQTRYVLFFCANTAPSNASTIFRYDRVKDEVEIASLDTSGAQIIGNHNRGAISGDGRYVAFYSSTDLVAEDTNGDYDTYLRDLKRDRTTLLVTGLQGAVPDQGALFRSMSANMRFVTVVSNSTNLDSLGANGAFFDVYRFDRKRRISERVSVTPAGGLANESSNWCMISEDGSHVAFYSDATNLTADADNAQMDVFVRRMKIPARRR